MIQTPQLVYLAFGAETYQREAVFSIASALTHASQGRQPPFAIQVFTDNPAFYAKLPVTTRDIDPAWRGPHDYHFRIKHVALQTVLQGSEKAVLIDTDTFFRTTPEALFQLIGPGRLLCNAISPPLAQAQALPDTLAPHLCQRELVDPTFRQTNSGVIGLDQADNALLERSIRLMDELYPLAPQLYTLEELCLALAAHRRMQLFGCTDVIHHYWSRKAQFRAKINAWYNKHQHDPLSPQAMEDVLLVNDRLPRPPQPYRGWQKLLTLLAPRERRQFFREALYGCHDYGNEFDHACSSIWWDKALDNLMERQERPLNASEIRSWLGSPMLKQLAGRHYPAMHSHLLDRLQLR